jgi:hypothetical protein
MSNGSVKEFFQKLKQDTALEKEYDELMADNISLVVIVEFARQMGFGFTTRELAEYLIIASSTRKAHEPQSNIVAFSQKAG